MKIPFTNIEVRRTIKNALTPPKEQQAGGFTYQITPAVIVDADIAKYKTAFVKAHGKYSQQRIDIYDIYQNALDFDAHLIALIERRLLATSGKAFQYTVAGEPNEAAKIITDSPKFQRLIDDVLMVKFWGMGLFEFETTKQGWLNYHLIPIKHIDPFRGMVLKDQVSPSSDDKPYTNVPTAVFLGDANDFGLLQQLSLIAMYKRAALGDWSQYSQLAATNFRVIKYRGSLPDPNSRLNIRDIVNNSGNGTLDLPPGIDVETSNQTSSSQNQLFENYMKYLDDVMTKLVLGQTMTTEDGSSRSQAEVHERTQEDIFDADGKYVLDVLNYEFYEVLNKLFSLPTGGRWEYIQAADSQVDQIETDLKLKDLITIDPEYFYTKYNVPRPADIIFGNLAQALGVGGLQSLQSIIADPNLTPDQKINTLNIVFGITVEDAKRIVAPVPTAP